MQIDNLKRRVYNAHNRKTVKGCDCAEYPDFEPAEKCRSVQGTRREPGNTRKSRPSKASIRR